MDRIQNPVGGTTLGLRQTPRNSQSPSQIRVPGRPALVGASSAVNATPRSAPTPPKQALEAAAGLRATNDPHRFVSYRGQLYVKTSLLLLLSSI